jgi:hypothetical protein
MLLLKISTSLFSKPGSKIEEREQGGANPNLPSDYYLPRTLVKPSEVLLDRVFGPWGTRKGLKFWRDTLAKGEGDQSLCAHGFVANLTWYSEVILQDSVLLRQAYPDHSIFSHRLFQSPEYLAFETELLEAMASSPDPRNSDLNRLVPEIGTRLDNGFARLLSSQQVLHPAMRAHIENSEASQRRILGGVQDIAHVISGSLSGTFSFERPLPIALSIRPDVDLGNNERVEGLLMCKFIVTYIFH